MEEEEEEIWGNGKSLAHGFKSYNANEITVHVCNTH
jgi:hypothetical protein